MRKQKTDWMRDQVLLAKRIEKTQHEARTVVVVVVVTARETNGEESVREGERAKEGERENENQAKTVWHTAECE